ncbi:hypothetical protein CHGG_07698 [Chaetomium globosum CBS 148.51]|uniref:BRCT domain-containing protein n=1 Tax=Chaetomium globosum (strain ATCC 6205 / CBS 148.51 / DSM 1962 / NBRC 6347 / NRRL 1970) TaxID=306901 RepID=Q2GWF6_CHAGB|nr:uncharacterized protein CHGG_07698 [Chaetomium globosum CBS 148.51]EAQ86445.1 hypothetical protein CHGG_07698 [Chaetomium globosum CBS 148.51]
MQFKTLRQAEKTAIDGTNESQDTLLLAHHLMMDFGVGLRSSSPTGDFISPLSPNRSRPMSGKASRNTLPNQLTGAEKTRGTRLGDTEESQHSSIPETQDIGILRNELRNELRDERLPDGPDRDVAFGDGVVGDLNLPDTLPLSAEIDSTSRLRRKKMESTQSSTQSNAGRSYDQYCRPLSPGHTPPNAGLPRSSSPDHRDIGDDGAGIAKEVTDEDDSGFVDFGDVARFHHGATQKTDLSPTQHLPETPTPQNPFRHSRSELLPTSQLFRGTQFSSPVKLASPTSSRPSPADFPGNSISPNPIISSPLKARGLRSSPVAGNPVVPRISHDRLPGRGQVQNHGSYEPVHKSQERRSTSEVQTDPVSSEDEDDLRDSIVRRRKAKQNKEAALRQLTAISFPRPSKSDDVEVPSTSQRKRTSQAEAPVSNRSEGPGAMTELPLPAQRHVVEAEDSTQSDVEEEPIPTVDPTPGILPDLPQPSPKPVTQAARDADIETMPSADAIPETSPANKNSKLLAEIATSIESAPSEVKVTPNFQSSPPAFSTRSRKGKGSRGYPRASSSSSTLSNLASTPQLPSRDRPETASTARATSPAESTIVASSSPAVTQTKRRDARGRLSTLKTSSTESLRQSSRMTRRGSNSTDELARSIPGTPTFEQSLRISRLSMSRSTSRSGHSTMKPPPTQRNQKLFENMAFAISFQSRKPGENNDQYHSRIDFSAMVQKRIKQAGGRILENGFDELFEVSPMATPSSSPTSTSNAEAEISLTPEGQTTGFTALIADGHSRKAKYMQALALGLPCIAVRWVTACLERNELVDWTPYLLCAGQSTFLGDAIRSRTLSPYRASTAKLAGVIDQREKLLEGSRILAVVKKAQEGKKMAYVFLARVLGASLTRVYSVEEAKAEMRAAEDAGQPFDWVYVDGKLDEETLFAVGPVGGKKRKRASAASFAAQPPVKRVRTLSDELVIQSLILGRLIEEGEMEC